MEDERKWESGTHRERTGAYAVLAGKSEGRSSLGRPTRRW